MLTPVLAAGYRATSFLDGRSMAHAVGTCRYIAPLKQFVEVARWGIDHRAPVSGNAPGHRVHFIFHIGHTSSTLISRALEEIPSVFVLREPPLLKWMEKTLRNSSSKELAKIWKSPVLPWLSRRHWPEHTVLVKVAAGTLRFMKPAVRKGTARALFVYSGLRTHLTVSLEHLPDRFPEENYDALEVKGSNMSAVFKRFRSDAPAFQELTIVRRMVLAWFKRLAFAWKLPAAQVLRVRMDEFLAEPAAQLEAAATFLGLDLDASAAKTIARGPLFKEHAIGDAPARYDHEAHAGTLADRARHHRTNIDDGIDFAKALLKKYTALQDFQDLIDV